MMKKFYFFPLWKIEDIEKNLEKMEQNGYRLDNIKHSYWFYFKESTQKQVCYFMSCKSLPGQSMAYCDCALLSEHQANPIESKMCFYTMYRTKERKEKMSLLYEARLDFIKTKLFEYALTALFLTIINALSLFAAAMFSEDKDIWIAGVTEAIYVLLTVYYFYGYFKQRKKCKKYEHNHFNT